MKTEVGRGEDGAQVDSEMFGRTLSKKNVRTSGTTYYAHTDLILESDFLSVD